MSKRSGASPTSGSPDLSLLGAVRGRRHPQAEPGDAIGYAAFLCRSGSAPALSLRLALRATGGPRRRVEQLIGRPLLLVREVAQAASSAGTRRFRLSASVCAKVAAVRSLRARYSRRPAPPSASAPPSPGHSA